MELVRYILNRTKEGDEEEGLFRTHIAQLEKCIFFLFQIVPSGETRKQIISYSYVAASSI